MSDSVFAQGVLLATAVILALILWAPTVLVFRHRRQRGESLSIAALTAVLAGELAVLAIVAATVIVAALPNPGGYVLAAALIIGALGPRTLSFIRLRRDG